jgi:mannose-6-phosphate isomerase
VSLLPVRIEPRFISQIWGARSLEPLFPGMRDLKNPVGEVWLTGEDCRFAEGIEGGPWAGQSLAETWPSMPPEWKGRDLSAARAFPLLVKFLFPADKLSIQVHPNDEFAGKHEAKKGGIGKTEMWYVVEARPGADVLVNLKPDVDEGQLRRAIAGGSAEECLERIPIAPGDGVFVPAGAVHSIGPGCTLCEIQQQSDITYRLFDYHRGNAPDSLRELRVEKAMQVIRFGERRGGKMHPAQSVRAGLKETFYAACPYFSMERWQFHTKISAASGENFDLLIFLSGAGAIECAGRRLGYAPANVWLVPASLGEYELVPASSTTLLRTSVPKNLNEVIRRLAAQGVSEAVRSRVVYS